MNRYNGKPQNVWEFDVFDNNLAVAKGDKAGDFKAKPVSIIANEPIELDEPMGVDTRRILFKAIANEHKDVTIWSTYAIDGPLDLDKIRRAEYDKTGTLRKSCAYNDINLNNMDARELQNVFDEATKVLVEKNLTPPDKEDVDISVGFGEEAEEEREDTQW